MLLPLQALARIFSLSLTHTRTHTDTHTSVWVSLPLWMMCHVWRTHGSSPGTDSILNEAGVCELLKRLSSFLCSVSISLFPLSLFRSSFFPFSPLLFLSHTLLPPPHTHTHLYYPLLNKLEEGWEEIDLWISTSGCVCAFVWFEWCWLIQCCPWGQIWPILQPAVTVSKVSCALRQSLFTAVHCSSPLTSNFFRRPHP